MKPILSLLSAFLIPLIFLPACSARGEAHVLRQEIRVRLDPARGLLAGESALELAPGAAGTLSLSINRAAEIESVAVDGRDAPFRRRGERLAVELPSGKGRASLAVKVRYHCTFNDPVPEQPVATEDPTYGVSGAITPRGTYLGSDAGWYPAPAAVPPGRSVTVTAPAGTEAITAGRRVARGTAGGVTTSTWEEEHPAGNLSLSAGPYVIEERTLDGLPLYTYLYPENAPLAGRYLEAAAGHIRFYAGLFGPYPFEKFAVVENFFPTGYGFPSYTLIGGTVMRLPFIASTSLPHEIAHCWWGNGVLVDYREGNWSEGLATYLADHLMEERKSPREGRDYRFRLLSDYASLVGPGEEFPLGRFAGRVDPASRAIGYGKGAMLFHMVRKRIGDGPFFGALRELFRERRFSAATWGDFARAFSKASGRDMASFMAPWLERTGGPRLALAEVTRSRAAEGWEVRGEVRQEGATHAVPVTVRVEGGGKRHDREVALAGGRGGFALALTEPPERVVLDPEVDLFRLLSPAELPATVNRIKGSTTLAAVVARRCAADEETLRLLLRSLGREGAPVVREEDADPSFLAGRDLLVCGVPERSGLLPQLPPGISVTEKAFLVDGERYAGSGDLLWAVGPRPGVPGRVSALFLPLAPAAAERSALKITHYGRYGLLVFSGGENRKKETVPPAGGESVVTFPHRETP